MLNYTMNVQECTLAILRFLLVIECVSAEAGLLVQMATNLAHGRFSCRHIVNIEKSNITSATFRESNRCVFLNSWRHGVPKDWACHCLAPAHVAMWARAGVQTLRGSSSLAVQAFATQPTCSFSQSSAESDEVLV